MADAQREQLNKIKKAFMKFLQAHSMESSFVVAGRPISIWDFLMAARTFEMTISQQIDHPSKFHFVGAQLGLPTDPQTGQISSQFLRELQKRYIQLITVIRNATDLSNRQIPLPQTNANRSHPERNITMLHGAIDLYPHVDFSGVSRDTVANLWNYQFETRLRSYISDWDRVFNNKHEAGDTPYEKLQTPVPGLVIMNNPRIPTTAGNEQAHEPIRDLTETSTLQERTHERSSRANFNDSETEAEFLSLPISANTTTPIIQSFTSTIGSVPQITALESALAGTDSDDASRKTIESLQNHPQLQPLLSTSQEIQREVIVRLKKGLDEYEQVILHLQAENRHPEAAECMARRHKWRLLMFVLIDRESLAQEARYRNFAMTIGSVTNSHTLQNRFRWRGSLIITDAEGTTYPELLVLLETIKSSPRLQDDALAAWPRRISVTPIKQLNAPDEFNNWVERSKPEEMFAVTSEMENWPDSQRTPENLRVIQESMRGFSLAHRTVFMGGVVLHGVINLATGGTDSLILFPATILGHVPPQQRILVARYSSPPNLATLPGVSFSIPASLPSDPAPPATPQSTLPTAGANSDLESRLNNEDVESNRMDPGLPRPILLTSSYWAADDRERIVALIEAHGDDYKAIAAKLSLKSHNQVRNYIKGRRYLCEVLNRVLLEKARHHT